jgi:ABC-type multidrug transport system fused ATPase/permease subunit
MASGSEIALWFGFSLFLVGFVITFAFLYLINPAFGLLLLGFSLLFLFIIFLLAAVIITSGALVIRISIPELAGLTSIFQRVVELFGGGKIQQVVGKVENAVNNLTSSTGPIATAVHTVVNDVEQIFHE